MLPICAPSLSRFLAQSSIRPACIRGLRHDPFVDHRAPAPLVPAGRNPDCASSLCAQDDRECVPAGIILLARTLPATLLAPFFGRYIDRVGIYQATIIGLLLSALGVATIPLLAGLPALLVVCAFIQGAGQILLFPVVAFYLPALVNDRDLDMANSAFRTFAIAGGLAGTALGGLLVSARLYALTFGLDALLALLALGTVVVIGRLAGARPEEEKISFWQAFVPVLQVVRQNPTLLSMLAIDAALYFAIGAIGVALPVYTTALSQTPWLYTSALFTANVAELLGGLLAPHVNRRIPAERLAFSYGLCALTMALAFLAISLWISAISVLLFTFLTSLLLGVLYVLYGTYMQKSCADCGHGTLSDNCSLPEFPLSERRKLCVRGDRHPFAQSQLYRHRRGCPAQQSVHSALPEKSNRLTMCNQPEQPEKLPVL